MKFHPQIIVHVDLKRKFGELGTFSELISSFNNHISSLLTAARMLKFDAAWTKKLENFYLSTLIFGSFSQNLSGSGRETGLPKKMGGGGGVTDHLSELIESEVNAKDKPCS